MVCHPYPQDLPFCSLVVDMGRGHLAEDSPLERAGLGKILLRRGMVPAPALSRFLTPRVLSLFPKALGRPLEPANSVLLSWGTQGHFLLVSIPATWHILESVLEGAGGGGREVRANSMGGEKASQHATVEPASPSPLPFYVQGNKPRQQRPLARSHLACSGRTRARTQDSELPVIL